MTQPQLQAAFSGMDGNQDGRIDVHEFEAWWNSGQGDEGGLLSVMHQEMRLGGDDVNSLKKLGGGAMLG